MSGYTPAGNFAPTVEGPAGTNGVDGVDGATGAPGESTPEGFAVAFDFEREEMLSLDCAFLNARLDEWEATTGCAATFSTEDAHGVYDLTVTGTVGGNWIRATPENVVAGLRTFEVCAGAGTDDWICLELYGAGGLPLRQWFDLVNGAIGTATGGAEIVDAKIERVDPTMARAFWRCRLVVDAPVTSPNCLLRAADADASLVSNTHATDPALVLFTQYQQVYGSDPRLSGPATQLTQRRIERVDNFGWLRLVHGFQADPTRQPFYFDREVCEWGGFDLARDQPANVGAFFGGVSSNADGARWLEIIGAAGVSELVRRFSDLGLHWSAWLAARPLTLANAAPQYVWGIYQDTATDRAERAFFVLDTFSFPDVTGHITATLNRQVVGWSYEGENRRLSRRPLLPAPADNGDLRVIYIPQPAEQLRRHVLGGIPPGLGFTAAQSEATIWGFYLEIRAALTQFDRWDWVCPRHGVATS